MRTVLHAILDAANCRDESKDATPTMRGVVVEWVTVPESEHLSERVIRCYATDGKRLAVVHAEPGANWPEHEPLVIHADSIKPLAQLLKRVEDILDQRGDPDAVVCRIETWCAGYDDRGQMVRPRKILRVDVTPADDGIILQTVAQASPPNIAGIMTPRCLRMGAPAGRLHTGYVSAAQSAVGSYDAPVWWTDGRCAFLFNPNGGERHLDFALVMPVVHEDEELERWPWGKPDGAERPSEIGARIEVALSGSGPDLEGAELNGIDAPADPNAIF